MNQQKIEHANQCALMLFHALETMDGKKAEDALDLTKSIIALLAWMQLSAVGKGGKNEQG